MATDNEELVITSTKLTEILEEAQGNEEKVRELVDFYVSEAAKLAASAETKEHSVKCEKLPR